ncbi:hypothetical protein ATANTOWER_012291 [Ataeniobius toweri]|uniref:Uncharacterized protein n=1 Tax=Ataeniobius toweri TaxID=208326 RepID=A0ABU7AR37_9TELE|nr:hypothetical protein [Ataeniobius toweri]
MGHKWPMGCTLDIPGLTYCSSGCMLRSVSSRLQPLSQDFLHDLPSSIFLSLLTSFPAPAQEKHPHNMMLQPLYFIVGMMFCCDAQCYFSATHDVLNVDQKVRYWPSLARVLSSTR